VREWKTFTVSDVDRQVQALIPISLQANRIFRVFAVVRRIFGHADQTMVQRYAHLSPEAFEGVRDIFGSGKGGKVIKMKRRKAK